MSKNMIQFQPELSLPECCIYIVPGFYKLMQVMLERDNEKPLQGRVELDDSCWGGERRGGKRGCGAEAKQPFVAAVQTTEDEKPLKMKLSMVIGFQSEEIGQWSQPFQGE